MWYNKYKDLPFKHLGNDVKTGLDCVNLCLYVIQKEKGIIRDYDTSTFCTITDNNWYNNINSYEENPLRNFDDPTNGWVKVSDNVKIFDVIILNIGSTNMPNHCSLYVGNNKMLSTKEKTGSYITSYGSYYKQFTVGKYRCKEFMTN